MVGYQIYKEIVSHLPRHGQCGGFSFRYDGRAMLDAAAVPQRRRSGGRHEVALGSASRPIRAEVPISCALPRPFIRTADMTQSRECRYSLVIGEKNGPSGSMSASDAPRLHLHPWCFGRKPCKIQPKMQPPINNPKGGSKMKGSESPMTAQLSLALNINHWIVGLSASQSLSFCRIV